MPTPSPSTPANTGTRPAPAATSAATPRPAATAAPARTATTAAPPTAPHERLVSLDAYRGMVMLAMVSGGFGLPALAASEGFKDSPFWKSVAFQFDHVPWVGCCFWDLIQPSFMFMVGTALAFSGAKREAQGQSFGWMLFHAAWRSLVLILLGIFLRSNGRSQTYFYFVDVVTQIGLGYIALFVLWRLGTAAQWVAAVAILVGYWGWFVSYPSPAADFNPADFNIPANWSEHMTEGFDPMFNLNTHPAAAFENWFMNRFPQPDGKEFKISSQGYCTLNFIPSLATMIFGLIAGEWLRGDRSKGQKLLGLLVAGAIGMAIGFALDYYHICPVVKRIWTPSWAIYAGGITSLMLAGFFLFFDILPLKSLAKPLAVVGANSIAIYCMAGLLKPWILKSIKTHFGTNLVGWLNVQSWIPESTRQFWVDNKAENIFDLAGPAWTPVITSVVGVLALWAICWCMDRKKLYVKI